MDDFKRDMDRLASSMHPVSGLKKAGSIRSALLWSPDADLTESGGQYTLCLDLPGMRISELEVGYEGKWLSVKGERTGESVAGKGVLLKERYMGSFSRAFLLPKKIDGEHIKAEFDDGVLTITAPKAATEWGPDAVAD